MSDFLRAFFDHGDFIVIKPRSAMPVLERLGAPRRLSPPLNATTTASKASIVLGRRSPEPIPDLIALLYSCSWEDLAGLIQHDPELTEALYGEFPETASHLDFDELTPMWVRKVAPQILRAIGHFKNVQQWSAAEATLASLAIDRIVSDLLLYLGLPETRTLACTALVIIFIKGLSDPGPADPNRTL